MQQDCIFCRIIRGEIPSKRVFENEHVVAVEDINPQAPVHILILPKKHLSTSLEITREDAEMLCWVFLAANDIARSKGVADKGYRIVMNCNEEGGQVIFHLHFHLLAGRHMLWPPG